MSCCVLGLAGLARAEGTAPSNTRAAPDHIAPHGKKSAKLDRRPHPRRGVSSELLEARARIAKPDVADQELGAAQPDRARQRLASEIGIASWYGTARNGRRTASGEQFDKTGLTAAHPTLPLQSRVRVTNMANGRSVTVRVTDRGPINGNRIIDLSQSAAEQIGMKHAGLARVAVETMPGAAPLEAGAQ